MKVQFQIGSAYATTFGTFLVLGRTAKTIQLQHPNGSVCTKTLRFLVDGAEYFYTNTGAHKGCVSADNMMPKALFKSISNPPFDMPTYPSTPQPPVTNPTDLNVGDSIFVSGIHRHVGGTIMSVKPNGVKRIGVLLDTTTTGHITTFSLRKDGRYVAVGYSMDDASWGGWFSANTIPNAPSQWTTTPPATPTDLTELQTEMLLEIQECENDGLGMGYSEFDGEGLTPQEKGVLGSLVAAGYVYNAQNEGSEPMYCSNPKSPTLTLANGPRDGIKGQNV
jgi:hypothetical protein